MTALALWAEGIAADCRWVGRERGGEDEVFTEANRFGADYEVMLYSADGREVASSTGMRFGVNAAAADCGPLEIALVAGSDNFPSHPVSPELVEAARILAKYARRTASICTASICTASICTGDSSHQ